MYKEEMFVVYHNSQNVVPLDSMCLFIVRANTTFFRILFEDFVIALTLYTDLINKNSRMKTPNKNPLRFRFVIFYTGPFCGL